MGIDYGKKRVGIAITDDSGKMAFPHDTFLNDSELLKKIVTLIEVKKISEIVIGYSLNKDGVPNDIHKRVEELITDLTLECGIPIHLEPEQYSTQEALHIQGKNNKTDASAAAIILNSFITKKK